MRIITGKARGAKLFALEGEATRPTSERAKEAIFSMINFDLEGREVLDLFAGSGQLGLEAASRDAKHVTMVDNSKAAVEIINRNVEKTKLGEFCTVIRSDYNDFLRGRRTKVQYDIVLLDPPYAQKLVPSALEGLLSGGFLKHTTIIVCETAEDGDVFGSRGALKNSFKVIKNTHYGIAHVTLLMPKDSEEAEAGAEDGE